MAFDQPTRNRLQRFVNEARRGLEEEFTRQLQNDYGMDPASGMVADLASLRHISADQRETARILRETLAHYTASGEMTIRQGLDRIVREQAFTIINRLAALRMAEARAILIESVGNGFQAKGFQLYARLAGPGLGETGDAYRVYLLSIFDELALDLPGLFDRYSPQGRLFPRQSALLQVLKLVNDPEIEPLWGEDETIGWIYQYFNSKDERKAMRDASQAPRNSRELAVRNQFFTPRYVVEFLVDNTLGRLWFNATGGATRLRDRCQYLLVKPDEQPEAAARLRDPRTLKLLDPACGSMHFGLYAFDLFAEIYLEAWDWEERHGPGSLDLSTTPQTKFKPLCQAYPDADSFRRDIPRLIIEHNIYGVDIDPRAAQIASLALWLRAQRAWNEAGVSARQRPPVGAGNVIAATAPPAEPELRQQFTANLDPLDAELFEKTLQMLKGLPELGVLLQVERELPQLIEKVYGKNVRLFEENDKARTWAQIEADLRAALTNFAQAATSTYQGRLFAQDALQGLRMIDLCREVFDVVVMNPPFGALASNTRDLLSKAFPDSKSDLLSIFVERGLELLCKGGFIGAITSRAPFFLSSLEKWRNNIIYGKGAPRLFADLGMGVMDDAMVEAAAYVIQKQTIYQNQTLQCLRALTSSDKEQAIRRLVNEGNSSDIFNIDVDVLRKSPGQSFAYWIPHNVLDLLSTMPSIDPCLVSIRVGMQTGDDWRFLRQWWEVDVEKIVITDDSGIPFAYSQNLSRYWVTYTKTDQASPWFSPLLQVVKWIHCGDEYIHFQDKNGNSRARLQNIDAYFKPGFSYMLRSARLVPYLVPAGAIPTAGRAQAFGDEDKLLVALLVASSNLGSAWARLTGEKFAWPKFQAGMVQSIPCQQFSQHLLEKFRNVVGQLYAKRRTFFERQEPYREFFKPAFFYLSEVDNEWSRHSLIGDSLDVEVAEEYGLTEYEYELTQRDLQEAIAFNYGAQGTSEIESSAEEVHEDLLYSLSNREIFAGLISYVIGLCFGRWDVRIAIDGRTDSFDVSPFSPLPKIPPGMLVSRQKDIFFQKVYPAKIAIEGVLTSQDKGVSELALSIREYFEILSEVRTIDEALICSELGFHDLEAYVNRSSGFFADHLDRYTAGGRKAPIYWPLSTSSGSYTLWIYYPSLTSQTLYTAVNNFVEPKIKQTGEAIARLRAAGSTRSRGEERQLEELQEFEQELTELRDTLLRLAPGYQPNHDDGVQITAAPLWPLFRHKPWQKLLRETWAKLEKGDYDWAHLAMSYWPERVREKCRTDKSLAIAHGLEELYIEPEGAAKGKSGRKRRGEKE